MRWFRSPFFWLPTLLIIIAGGIYWEFFSAPLQLALAMPGCVSSVEKEQRVNPSQYPMVLECPFLDRGGPGVTNIDESIVYDNSDQVLLPAAKRSADWWHSAGGQHAGLAFDLDPNAGKSGVYVRRLNKPHYYLQTWIR